MAAEVAAVFSLGNTADQCVYALERICADEPLKPDLFFLYGEPFPNQKGRTPLDAIAELKPKLDAMGLSQVTWKATQASSLDACYRVVLELLRDVSKLGYRRVYLCITGGANPMVAALFHAGMSELEGEVVPVYVQGLPTESGMQQSIELIRSTGARDAIQSERVLGLARAGRLQAAAALAADLPARGPAGFLREAVEALASWDQFDYSAAERMSSLRQRAQDQPPGENLARIAETILRYVSIAQRAASIETVVAKPEAFAAAAGKPGWAQRLEAQGVWLPLDALANGLRRSAEGAYTEAVMRAYRAVELSLQYRLFRLGVHPSALNWGRAPLAGIASTWRVRCPGVLPEEVAFEQAYRLLEALESRDYPETAEARRELQSMRNSCYLEHGYQRVGKKACASGLEKAKFLCARFLEIEGKINGMLDELRMNF